MKACKHSIRSIGFGSIPLLACLLAMSGQRSMATDYLFNLTSGTGAWGTSTVWTPNGIPTAGDNIDYAVNGASSVNLTVGGVTRTVNAITKTGTQRWDIIGQSATLSTLNAQTLTVATTNMIFRDGNSGGGLQLNLGSINMTAGTLFFGSTSLSASNLMRGLSVSGTTTISGGALQVNVDNATDSYSLGLLNVSGAATVNLNNAPTGKGASTGNVTGINGTGGFIQVAPNVGQTTNTATLAITNTIDYSSATVLRDSVTSSLYGTLSLSKAGPATQTLTGANTFTGAASITNGVLKMGNASTLGGRTGIVAANADNGTNISGTGTLDLAGQTNVIEVIRLNGHGMGGNGALINSSTAASIGNGVAMISQTTGGIGATPTLTISGGDGAGATATVSMGVTSTTFTINGGTTVYSVAPTVTISGGGATTAATATANLTGGVVTSITITAPGGGYTTTPTIAFSAGTITTAGTNPTGTGNATNFTPVSYSITNTGASYTSTPTIGYSSGPFAATLGLSGIVLMGDSSIGGSGDITVSGPVSESGGARSLTKVGSNTLTLANTGNSFTGATNINGGAVSIAADSALGTAPGTATPAHLTFNAGTLITTADLTLAANRGISLGAGGGTLSVASTLLSYGGIIDGTGSLTKTGTGKLALSGASTYTGATLVSAGTLAVSNATALGTAAGGVAVANLATLELSGGIAIGAEALTLTGDGAVAATGALLNLSGNNSWAGNIDVTAGNTRINSEVGNLLISGNVATIGTGNFNVGGNGDIEISGIISGPLLLFKSSVGGGTLTLSNPANTYTGHTTIANGTVKISSEGNLGATPEVFSSLKIRIRGGTLQTTADMSISANRGLTISNGGGAISPDAGTTLTINSRISGTVATDTLFKTGGGTLVLAGASTYIGPTQVNAGTLMVTNATGSATGTGALTIVAGTLAGHHAGAGNIAGGVTIGTGAFISPGNVTSSIGTLNLTSLDLQAGATGQLNIDGTSEFDRILVSATDGLTLNGRLTITTDLTGPAFDAAFAPGSSFDLIDWAGLIGGAFNVGDNFRDGSADDADQFDLPNLASLGRSWDISQFLSNGTLLVVPEPSRILLLGLSLAVVFGRRQRRIRSF